MMDINLEALEEVCIDQRFKDIISECDLFKERILKKMELFKQTHSDQKGKIEQEIVRIREDREFLENEKKLWAEEKKRMQEI